jgi:hypothetical protein
VRRQLRVRRLIDVPKIFRIMARRSGASVAQLCTTIL